MKNSFIGLLLAICLSNSLQSKTLPTAFDLRNVNGEDYISEVKKQQGGTCWTHAVMSAIESNLMVTNVWSNQGENGEPNLAEYHLDWWNGFNKHYNQDLTPTSGHGLQVHQGGDYLVASAYFSRLEGAVRENDGQSYNYAPEHTSPEYHYYYARNIEWFNMDENLNGIDAIKETLMNNGAIGTCMRYNQSYIDYSYNHYQPLYQNYPPNHAVSIIGWDDNRQTPAQKPGAWLVKNSWGTTWGHGGYFWISYYDRWSCREPFMGAVAFKDVEPLKYTGVLYHDYHGWRKTREEIKEAFNYFSTEGHQDSQISAVSFFSAADNVNYEIKIYYKFDGQNLSELASTKTGSITHKGFHTIDLEDPVPLANSDHVAIYLSLDKGGHPIDITSDVPVLLGSSQRSVVKSTASSGESFYKDNSQSWKDFYNYNLGQYSKSANFCIKGLLETANSIDEEINNSNKSLKLQGNYPNPFNPQTTIKFQSQTSQNLVFRVYSNRGQVVESRKINAMPGENSINFNAKNLNSGLYFYRIIGKNSAVKGKMLFLK